jgi:hypothetical protein
MERKECGRKPLLYNVSSNPEETEESHEHHGLYNRSMKSLSYEAGIPTTRLRRSVFSAISEVKELCYYLYHFRNSLKVDVEYTHNDKNCLYVCDVRNKLTD